ncbi:mechanosensitive ion channel domain-containing protein [Shewanella violacea]|uniref:Transporter, putative n=1 Tax=Shewanella violacea (strain JCM 10179 / CIP 106290 / LMG 19151 / DSS12) TaxID=637905 RepID=D4ZFJ7_SHEVD|nr:mechanosensitive ion channel domain-containing protein [Shewanella violacea]BAJ00446.1 transporter, putative [Shewanella violacea DSS12]
MRTIFLLLIALTGFSAVAGSPLELNKRLGLTLPVSTDLTTEQKLAHIQHSIEEQALIENNYLKLINNYQGHKLSLDRQLKEAKTPLPRSKNNGPTQQASLAYLRLSELKEIEAQLNTKATDLIKQHNRLPSDIASARQSLTQHQKNKIDDSDTNQDMLLKAQRQLYIQTLEALEAEQASSQKRINLNQQQMLLVRYQLSQQESLIEEINKATAKQRQKKTDATIAKSLFETSAEQSPLTQQLSRLNLGYANKLKGLTKDTNLIVLTQETAENLYQVQAKQLTNIQQQVGLIKLNSAFGERFLQMLQSLPAPPNQDKLEAQIAQARLTRYQLEQELTINNQQLVTNEPLTKIQSRLLTSQNDLITQLLQSQDLYLSKLSDLRVIYEQLTQQNITLTSILNEHLFWVPNAKSIDKLWFTDLFQSVKWLMGQSVWSDISVSLDEQSEYWSWWIILFVLCLVTQDLLTPKFKSVMAHDITFVGNVTQDQFSYTFSALSNSLLYSVIKPLPVIAAGAILLFSSLNLTAAIGMGVLVIGLLYLFYRFTYLLALEQGLLIGHFKSEASIIRQGQLRFKTFIIMAIPFFGVMGFTEFIDNSVLRNSIGRGAFIIFSIFLFGFYRDILSLSKKHKHQHQDDKNKKLLQRLLWGVLLLIPPVCAILAFRGYYYTAFQVLLQLQLSLLLSLGFMLLYQLIKRWMFIERRRIAFDRAKARRAEILLQRERERDEEPQNNTEPLDTYEEPGVDLETMASQSLGLVRSLLLLAFLASLIGLWSQTHTALFSLLDDVTLWTSNTLVNGIEQQLPITLKSLFLGLIIVGFSLMIATNLPGLLELTILQRLDLSQGTGFAITTVSRYLVVFFGILSGFSTLGMEWSKLQWLVAALSLGLGFGLQEIFANFISGLIILFEKPVRIGDTVTIRELTGNVSKIQIRATTIVDWDRKEIIIPNKAFITEQLINWSLSDPITRVIVYVSVARDSDPARVEAALYQAVEGCEDALESPEPEVWFAGFGQHTQDYEVRAYAKDMNTRWPLRHTLHKAINKKLQENQLELAYPQLEVHIKNTQSKETQGLIRS